MDQLIFLGEKKDALFVLKVFCPQAGRTGSSLPDVGGLLQLMKQKCD